MVEKLVVTAEKLKVGKHVLPRGAEFEVGHKEAKLLRMLGKAAQWSEPVRPAHVDMPTPPPAKAVDPDPAPVAPETAEDAAAPLERPRRAYRRRDMTAE